MSSGIFSSPYIHLDHLEQLCQAAYDAGALIVPWRDLGVCNLVPDNKFSNTSSHTLTAASGDTVQYTDSVVLNSMPRSVQLTATANRSSISDTRIRTNNFSVQPFTVYHITVAYRIDTELSRVSASNLWGLAAVWSTTQYNTEENSAGVQNDYDYNQRTGYSRPYQVTSGWARQTYTFYTGYAFGANIPLSLYNCTGTAYIGHIKVEKGRYFGDTGLRGSSTFSSQGKLSVYRSPRASVSSMTCHPRFLASSANAWAGNIWPPVPPSRYHPIDSDNNNNPRRFPWRRTVLGPPVAVVPHRPPGWMV